MKKELWNEGWKFWKDRNAFELLTVVPKDALTVELPYDALIREEQKMCIRDRMDKEAFSQTSEQYHSKINEGVVGCYYTWSPYADMSEAEAEKWVEVPLFDDGEGHYMKTGSQDKFAASRTGFCITSQCEAPDRLLQWRCV